jgi:hypothetical protein
MKHIPNIRLSLLYLHPHFLQLIQIIIILLEVRM